jgi:HEPN domain-containing protein
VAKAEVDYRTAERLVTDPDPIRESIAFHCQQAVEKYLKAFLVSLQVEFPKTHDLEQLPDLLTADRPDLAAELEGVKVLTPFRSQDALSGRFPGVAAWAGADGFRIGHTSTRGCDGATGSTSCRGVATASRGSGPPSAPQSWHAYAIAKHSFQRGLYSTVLALGS